MPEKLDTYTIRHKLLSEGFNDESVYYCTRCLSLKIRGMKDIEYCDQCGSVNIAITNIFDWENRYKRKYKHNFIEH